MNLKNRNHILFFVVSVFLFSLIQSFCFATTGKNKFFEIQKDTVPGICTLMPGADVAALSPFSNPLTNTESIDGMETYSACLYQFFKPNDYAAIKIELSNLNAADVKTIYASYIEDHRSLWGRDPERIYALGDSANFSYNADEQLCDDCGLTIMSGKYLIIINFKGQYEDVPRDKKKQAAIKIANLLFERLPKQIKKKQ